MTERAMQADTETDERGDLVAELRDEIGRCRICRDNPEGGPARRLPHEPNPVCVPSSTARIVICGQAPGTRVHASGRPFTDPSGDRLRNWLGMDQAVFYDDSRVAIVPMGFCFPGLDAKGGDLPPRRECPRQWHDRVFATMEQADLILAVGRYAQAYHLPAWQRRSLTETVSSWRGIVHETGAAGRMVWPLPHPSWRNNGWIGKNPWFEAELLPALRREVATRIAG